MADDKLTKENLDKENTYWRAVKDRVKDLTPGYRTVEAGVARPKREEDAMKKGGAVKKFAKGGTIDGIAQRGKTRGRYI